MTPRVFGYAGAAFCLLYALFWVVFWWTPETLPPMVRAFEPIVSGRSHMQVSALVAGALLFGASPLIREEKRQVVRVFHAIAIFALIAPGLWLMAAPLFEIRPVVPVTAMEAVLWLLVPALIAVWSLAGTSHPIWPRMHARDR